MFSKNLVFTEGFGLQEWINGSKIAFSMLFHSNLIIFIFTIISVLFAAFIKKEFDKKSLIFFIPLLFILFAILYKQTGLYPEPMTEINYYSIVFWFIFPVILSILLFDYWNIGIKKYFICNLFIVSCLFGSINLSWQIYSNIGFGQFVKTSKEIMKKSDDVIVSIPEELYVNTKHINRFSSCFSTMPASIIMSGNRKVEKVIAPQEYYYDYSQWCFYDSEKTYYNPNSNMLVVQTVMIKPQTSLIDVSIIVEEFKEKGYVKP